MNVVFRDLNHEELRQLMAETKDWGERRLITDEESEALDPMKMMLLKLLFSTWLVKLNNGEYEKLRTEIATAITTLEKKDRSVDIYVCGCEFPSDTGQVRHFEMRCPNCQYPGGRSEGIDEDD